MKRLLSPVRRHWVGALALFVALGGTSYAAVKLPANSVGTKQLKNGSVTKAKLAAGVALKGAPGAAGPQGPKGDNGAAGANGEPGAKGDTGAAGTNGSPGSPGTPGTPGLDGAALVKQMRCSNCAVNLPGTGPGGTSTPVTLTNNSWTQGANDAAQIDIEIGWQPLATSAGCSGPTEGASVTVKVDGNPIASQPVANAASMPPQVFRDSVHFWSTGAMGVRVVTVELAQNCDAADIASVSSAKVDVTALKG